MEADRGTVRAMGRGMTLDSSTASAYNARVTSKKGVNGFSSPCERRRRSRASILGECGFLFVLHGEPYGRAVRGAARLAGTFHRSANPHSSAHPFSSGEAVIQRFERSHAMTAPSTAFAPILAVVDGIPTTTSNEVARVFGKRHDHVLRDIEALRLQLDADHAPIFGEMVNEVQIGSGAIRKDPAYRLNRDGFTLLAMGFTGKRALQFKLVYIDAFNKMEAMLRAPNAPAQFFSSRRWLVCFRDGREVIQEIDWDECVLKYKELPELLAASDNPIASDLLVQIAKACIERMDSRNKKMQARIEALTGVKGELLSI